MVHEVRAGDDVCVSMEFSDRSEQEPVPGLCL
jgi:hypothetical protein